MAERYHHGNLGRELMDAALALFIARGRFDFTMRELARAAGVTHNAPYRHFTDRWALLDALAAEGFELLRARSLRAVARVRDPQKRVAKLGEAYVRFAAEHPHHFRLMYLRPLREAEAGEAGALAKAARASFAFLEEAMTDAHARGVLRKGLAPRDAVLTAWSLVHGVASLVVGGQLSTKPSAVRRRTAALADVFARGAFSGSRK